MKIIIFLILIAAYLSANWAESQWNTENIYKVEKNKEWSYSTWNKYDNLIDMWFNPNVTIHLIDQCKFHAKDPVNCIKIGASILWAESSMGWKCYRFNCFGMNDGTVAYRDNMDWVYNWVIKYNKWWYKQHTPASFYRDDWTPPITHYCMWKKKDGVCKEWKKNAWSVFNSLNF